MKKTIICQIRNEETLLPFWIKHHLPLFDHGIFIDFYSTDRTHDIIRELAPHWQIVNSVNERFDSRDIDMQVMATETMISGWKVSLNVTEFMLTSPDFDDFLAWSNQRYLGVILTGVTLCDTAATRYQIPSYDVPLLRQKHHGWFCSAAPGMGWSEWGQRDRIIHRAPHGKYSLGRHGTSLGNENLIFGFNHCMNVWAGWSPIEMQKSRKLAIKNFLSETDLKLADRSPQHKLDAAQLEAQFLERSQDATDLLQNAEYRRLIDSLPMSY